MVDWFLILDSHPNQYPVELMNPSDEALSSAEDEEVWAPQWKSAYESPQFKSGMIGRFLRRWKEEDFDHVDDSKFPAVRIFGTVFRGENCHKRLLAFLKQVRESRGYDVDVAPPRCVMSPFLLRHMDEIKLHAIQFEQLTAKVEFVVAQINAEAEKHRKQYALDEIEKVVEAMGHRSALLTLRVKQVRLSRRKRKRMKKVERERMKQLESSNANVVKTVQATVYAPGRNKFELLEWRFKPQQLLNTLPSSSSVELFNRLPC